MRSLSIKSALNGEEEEIQLTGTRKEMCLQVVVFIEGSFFVC